MAAAQAEAHHAKKAAKSARADGNRDRFLLKALIASMTKSTMRDKAHGQKLEAALEAARRRIVELEAENRAERANFKELHKVRSRLERVKVQREAQISALVAKCEDLQMLKFGQLIKLELLDQDAQANKGEEELHVKIEQLEAQHVSQLAALERKQKRAKEFEPPPDCPLTTAALLAHFKELDPETLPPKKRPRRK